MRAQMMVLLLAASLAGCGLIDSMKSPEPVKAPRGAQSFTTQAEFSKLYPGGVACPSSPCTVSVAVGPGCSFHVSPATLGIPANLQEATIRWVISPGSSGTVAFTGAGINPKDSGAWNREFHHGVKVSATEFTWVDKNKLEGAAPNRAYGYNIDVTQNGVACPRHDPTIVNGN